MSIMKIDRLHFLSLLMSHDLSCTFGQLIDAARRCAQPAARKPTADWSISGDLALAAVAFAIQLAIEAGRDPAQMRALERDLIIRLTSSPAEADPSR